MNLQPGIYRATVRGVPDTIVMVRRYAYAVTVDEVGDRDGHDPEHIADARPLIVLDLDDFKAVTTPATDVVQALRQAVVAFARQQRVEMNILTLLADQIEAQTKTPRIPEPGLHGVVEAKSPRWDQVPQWTRYTTGDGNREQWIATNGETAAWRSLIDPVLIRDGLS